MNIQRYIYNIETGEILSKFTGPDVQLKPNIPEGCGAIDAGLVSDPESQRVVSGEVVNHQPPAPSVDHVWNAEIRRWVVPPHVDARRTRLRAIEVELAALDAKSVRAQEDLLFSPNDANALKRFNDIVNKKDTLRGELRSLRDS